MMSTTTVDRLYSGKRKQPTTGCGFVFGGRTIDCHFSEGEIMLSRTLRSSVPRRVGAVRAKATTPHYPSMVWKKDTIVHKNAAATNSDEAYFCGVKPGTPREGWEVIYWGTWAIIVGLSAMVYYSEDTTIQVKCCLIS